MTYLEFHQQWAPYGCFNINQVFAWCPHFNRLNFRYWEKKGYIIRLRKEYYAFSEFLSAPDFNRYVAGKIYRPSYISLFTALSFYGMIPEYVNSIMNVTSLKTMKFENAFGSFEYRSVKDRLMFGFKVMSLADGKTYYMATPEKALLDTLYLYPFYKTEKDMLNLRLDEDFMEDEFNKDLFIEYNTSVGSKALGQRVRTLLKSYDLW